MDLHYHSSRIHKDLTLLFRKSDPFETYTATLYFFPVFVGNASAGEQPGIVLQQADLILNNLPSFAWDKPSVNTTEDYAQFQISFRRTPIVKVVVIFTWAVMHLWVVIVIFLTGQVIFRDREPQPIMTWVAASIFSMGAIRAAQPIAPAVGTVADMVTYIWAILVIALSSFICFVFNFRRYKPKPKDKELEKREKKMKWRKYLKEEAEEEKKKAETTASASTSTLTPSPESSSSSTPVLTSSHLNSSPPRQQIHQHYVPQTAYAPQQPAYAPETTYAPVTTQAYANAQQLPLAPPARVQSARRDVKEFVQQEYQGKLQEQYRRQ
ncbi:hypothetical protein BC829DRAFT_280188 [Chytridium lagenaria]|nr:hypothetical protein BC829DRAFT_280188 [Chytridium lagenaria]